MLAEFSRPSAIMVDVESPSYQLRAALALRLASHRMAARETMVQLASKTTGSKTTGIAPAAQAVAALPPAETLIRQNHTR